MPSQSFRSLFLQETIRRGVLAPSLVVSYTHQDEDIAKTLDAIDGALKVYRRALEDGVENYLVGRPSEIVFRRFNRSAPHPIIPRVDQEQSSRSPSLIQKNYRQPPA